MSLMATWVTAIKIKTAAVFLVCSQKPWIPWVSQGLLLSHKIHFDSPKFIKGWLMKVPHLSIQWRKNIQKKLLYRIMEHSTWAKSSATSLIIWWDFFIIIIFCRSFWKKFVTIRHLKLPKVKTEKKSSAMSKKGRYSRKKSATQHLELSGEAKFDPCSDASLMTDTSFYSGISQRFKASEAGDWGIRWI